LKVMEILENKPRVVLCLDEDALKDCYEIIKDQSATGDFIRWIFNDVLKECSPEMEASNIKEKDLGKLLAGPAKKWYFNRLNNL